MSNLKKKYFLRSLTLGAIGAKTRFFKMWPKSMHDQKLEIFYSLRPEDGLYGSNEPKKCEIRPVVSSIVHFKVVKFYSKMCFLNETGPQNQYRLRDFRFLDCGRKQPNVRLFLFLFFRIKKSYFNFFF